MSMWVGLATGPSNFTTPFSAADGGAKASLAGKPARAMSPPVTQRTKTPIITMGGEFLFMQHLLSVPRLQTVIGLSKAWEMLGTSCDTYELPLHLASRIIMALARR